MGTSDSHPGAPQELTGLHFIPTETTWFTEKHLTLPEPEAREPSHVSLLSRRIRPRFRGQDRGAAETWQQRTVSLTTSPHTMEPDHKATKPAGLMFAGDMGEMTNLQP